MNRIELAHIKKYLEHDDFVQSKKCLNMASFSNVQGMNSVYIKNTVSTEINPNQCAENLTNALSLDLSQFHISEHSVCKKRMKERIVNSNKKSIKSLASNDCQSLGKHNEYKDNKSTSAYNRSTVDSRRDFERFSPLEAHEGKSVVQSPLRKSLSEKCGGGKNVSRLRTDESYLQRMQSHERVEKTRDEEMSLLSHDDYTRTFKGFQGPTEKKECITGHKKRKKSESQRKKEYKDRLKLLPSIQGKVLTVSQDFYCLVADSNSECNVLKRKAGEQKMSFELEDFPVLCENTPKNSALTALNTLNEIYDSSYPSDSEWSDVACYDYSSDINVKSGREYNEDFPSLGCQSNPCVPGLEAYGSVRQKVC